MEYSMQYENFGNIQKAKTDSSIQCVLHAVSPAHVMAAHHYLAGHSPDSVPSSLHIYKGGVRADCWLKATR
jgi:hypothetical protein